MSFLDVNLWVGQQIQHEEILASFFCRSQNRVACFGSCWASRLSLGWCNGQRALSRLSTGDLELLGSQIIEIHFAFFFRKTLTLCTISSTHSDFKFS